MPRRRSNLRVRGKVTNVERVESSLARTAGAIDEIEQRSISELGSRSVDILRRFAPKGRTQQLEKGIKTRRRGAHDLDLTVHATARESGFDYAGITRFGHSVEIIEPTEGRKALRVGFQQGDVGYFANVRGFEPEGDWVDLALPEIRGEAERVAREAGHAIELRLFS